MRLMRIVLVGCVFLASSGSAWAVMKEPANAALKVLFEEMKSHAESEKVYRDEKKKEIVSIEMQIDKIREEAKAKGATQDPDSVKPLQLKRLGILEEVARRDVKASEESLKFAQKKLEISKGNLEMFEQKMAEARKTLGA